MKASNPCVSSVALFDIGWHNWYQDINTFAPIFVPKNDSELSTILNFARMNKCVVRTMGKGYSNDGVVNFIFVNIIINSSVKKILINARYYYAN